MRGNDCKVELWGKQTIVQYPECMKVKMLNCSVWTDGYGSFLYIHSDSDGMHLTNRELSGTRPVGQPKREQEEQQVARRFWERKVDYRKFRQNIWFYICVQGLAHATSRMIRLVSCTKP